MRNKVRGAKKPRTEQEELLAASKSYDADIERAEYIRAISGCVFREMCARCDKRSACHPGDGFDGKLYFSCRMSSIASVAVGMIGDKE